MAACQTDPFDVRFERSLSDRHGAQAALGRAFTELDYEPGAPAVVVVGEALWKTRYASDTSILGRTVTVNGTPSVIVGVMPATGSAFRAPGTSGSRSRNIPCRNNRNGRRDRWL